MRLTSSLFRFLSTMLCAGMLVGAASMSAFAQEKAVETLQIDCPDYIALARIDVQALPVSVSPSSIMTGIPCGMDEMCGLDPCLCGAVDQWGSCACNGLEETYPTVSLTCDGEGIFGVFEAFGATYVYSLGTGSAVATVHADLPHYASAEASLAVEVAPFGIFDVLKIAGALAVVAGVLAALFIGLRTAGRWIKRAFAPKRNRSR